MPLDLTNVKQQINNVKRNLYLNEGLTVRFLNISTVLLQLEDNWYLDKNPEKDNSSPTFHLLRIADAEIVNLDKIIDKTTSIKIGTKEYSSFQLTKPLDIDPTKEYLIKLQLIDGMERDI